MGAHECEAHADALEENARLKAAWDASHKQAMKNGAACNEWRDRAERAEAELAETRRDLQFIERWANHHGQKPNITPREVLSMIQHYQPILEITRSYEDGKVPDTPNPWAELAKLRGRIVAADAHLRFVAEYREQYEAWPCVEAISGSIKCARDILRADFPEEK